MAEYIDRKQAITEIIKTYEYEFPTASGAFDEFVTRTIPNVLKGIPAADVAPVRHGRWEDGPLNGYLHCSVCKDVYIDDTWLDDGKWNYCPNCGAKMDLEET